MNEIYFKFTEPQHGWMDITVSGEDQELTLVVSDVPCNSIYKLAVILISLQSGQLYEEVDFSLEPDYALWKFNVKGSEIELLIYPDASREKPTIFKSNKDQMIKRLYQGLKELESMPCWKNQETNDLAWSWEFPSEKLSKFKV